MLFRSVSQSRYLAGSLASVVFLGLVGAQVFQASVDFLETQESAAFLGAQAFQVLVGFLALAAFRESVATRVLAFQVFQARLDLAVRPDSQDFLATVVFQGFLDSQGLVDSLDSAGFQV